MIDNDREIIAISTIVEFLLDFIVVSLWPAAAGWIFSWIKMFEEDFAEKTTLRDFEYSEEKIKTTNKSR